MSNYLMKYKGKYRILPELDIETHDIPRENNGSICKEYDDIYIACYNGAKIYSFGRGVLVGYIPSIGRGRNVKKELDSIKFKYFDYHESNAEIEFKFKADQIDTIAGILKARTSGANISPYSPKNLPKSKIRIPEDEMTMYRDIVSKLPKNESLIITKILRDFMNNVLTPKLKRKDKKFELKSDMKRLMMKRQPKEYIYTKEMWCDFLKYLKDGIEQYLKEKA